MPPVSWRFTALITTPVGNELARNVGNQRITREKERMATEVDAAFGAEGRSRHGGDDTVTQSAPVIGCGSLIEVVLGNSERLEAKGLITGDAGTVSDLVLLVAD